MRPALLVRVTHITTHWLWISKHVNSAKPYILRYLIIFFKLSPQSASNCFHRRFGTPHAGIPPQPQTFPPGALQNHRLPPPIGDAITGMPPMPAVHLRSNGSNRFPPPSPQIPARPPDGSSLRAPGAVPFATLAGVVTTRCIAPPSRRHRFIDDSLRRIFCGRRLHHTPPHAAESG